MIGIVILSMVQGITEFLPISSSSHLIIITNYFGFSNADLTLDVSLHTGSLLAIILYFNNDLKNFYKNKIFFIKIIVSTIPLILFGYGLTKFNLIDSLRNYEVIGWATIIFGIILFLSDWKKTNKSIEKNFDYRSVIFIGIFQILSLIPGVSRSGIIITSARFLNYNRIDSAKISFFTSIPVLALLGAYNIYKIISLNSFTVSYDNLLGIIMSFFFFLFNYKIFYKLSKEF